MVQTEKSRKRRLPGLLSACGTSAKSIQETREVSFDGTELTVSLGTNKSTGYEWSFEIDGYLYVAMVLFALGFAQREDKHMKMDLLTGKVSGRRKNVLYIILACLGLAYAVILCVFGWQYAHAALIKGTRANSTFRSPVWPSFMALPIGSLGIGLQYIRNQYRDLSGQDIQIENTEDTFRVRIPLL